MGKLFRNTEIATKPVSPCQICQKRTSKNSRVREVVHELVGNAWDVTCSGCADDMADRYYISYWHPIDWLHSVRVTNVLWRMAKKWRTILPTKTC